MGREKGGIGVTVDSKRILDGFNVMKTLDGSGEEMRCGSQMRVERREQREHAAAPKPGDRIPSILLN
jgi:hypothetical protein